MMIKTLLNIFIPLCCLFFQACSGSISQGQASAGDSTQTVLYDTGKKVVHIYVALCDNKYQGIVPVPAGIGNGQSPATNLYWGCGFGVKTYFRKSSNWTLISTQSKNDTLLERLVFKHVSKSYYLVADAYNGKYIKTCTGDFLKSSAGLLNDTLHILNSILGIGGNASLLAYIGHDGLMDFNLSGAYKNTDGRMRSIIILACFSKQFFGPYLKDANVNPVVWTTGLMCPEAYTIHDALDAFIAGVSNENIRTRAARAYAKYQKCSEAAARRLLVSGW